VLNQSSKHWSDFASWEITKSIHNVVLSAIKKAIMASSFLLISVDEVITIDIQS
jgi:hypothetical protein